MIKKNSYAKIALALSVFMSASVACADTYRRPLTELKFKELPSFASCDTKFAFQLPGSGIKRTMTLTPAMVDVLEGGLYTTASIRLPFSGHMVHTIGLAPSSSKTIGYGAIDEHVEITVTRHNPKNSGENLVAIPDETSQAGLSSMYEPADSYPNYNPTYFHEFMDVSNWMVEFTCNKPTKSREVKK